MQIARLLTKQVDGERSFQARNPIHRYSSLSDVSGNPSTLSEVPGNLSILSEVPGNFSTLSDVSGNLSILCRGSFSAATSESGIIQTTRVFEYRVIYLSFCYLKQRLSIALTRLNNCLPLPLYLAKRGPSLYHMSIRRVSISQSQPDSWPDRTWQSQYSHSHNFKP